MASTCETGWQQGGGAAPFLGEHLGYLRRNFSFSGYERDLFCLNRGDGTFLDLSGVSGADSISDGRAAVFWDYDDDGDLDIFLRAMHGPARLLFRNEVGQERRFLRIGLVGTRSGRDAFGAIVRVKTRRGLLTKVKNGGSGFLAQHDPRLLFGLGDEEHAEWIEVRWPSGATQRLERVPAGSDLTLTER